MVVFGQRKYACLSCIRGHRSSSCEHKDRILLQVRKPGRKSQAEPQSRYALVAKELSPAQESSKESDYRLVKVPDVKVLRNEHSINVADLEDGHSDEDVVFTDKFVFVHVGDNLFRRELRPGYREPGSAKTLEDHKVPLRARNGSTVRNGNRESVEVPFYYNNNKAHMAHDGMPSMHNTNHISMGSTHTTSSSSSSSSVNSGHCCHGGEPQVSHHPVQQNEPYLGAELHHPIIKRSPSPGIPSQISQHHMHPRHENGGMASSQAHDPQAHDPQAHDPHAHDPHAHDSHRSSVADVHSDLDHLLPTGAPLVIGPMQYQNDMQNVQANILNVLGLSAEEATQIWPGDAGNAEFSYATQCVFPGQCQCGDGCECPECFEHKLKYLKRAEIPKNVNS